MDAVTQKEFAKIIGVTSSYVHELKKNGRLVLNSQNRVMVEESKRMIEETSDPLKTGVAEMHVQNRIDKEKPLGTAKFQDSRAKKEHFGALKAEIEHLKMTGELYEKGAANKAVANAATIARNRLESLPDMMAPQLAAEQDENKVRALLIDQIEFVLSELEQGFRTLGKQAKADA